MSQKYFPVFTTQITEHDLRSNSDGFPIVNAFADKNGNCHIVFLKESEFRIQNVFSTESSLFQHFSFKPYFAASEDGICCFVSKDNNVWFFNRDQSEPMRNIASFRYEITSIIAYNKSFYISDSSGTVYQYESSGLLIQNLYTQPYINSFFVRNRVYIMSCNGKYLCTLDERRVLTIFSLENSSIIHCISLNGDKCEESLLAITDGDGMCELALYHNGNLVIYQLSQNSMNIVFTMKISGVKQVSHDSFCSGGKYFVMIENNRVLWFNREGISSKWDINDIQEFLFDFHHEYPSTKKQIHGDTTNQWAIHNDEKKDLKPLSFFAMKQTAFLITNCGVFIPCPILSFESDFVRS